MSRLLTSVTRSNSAALRMAICSSFLSSDAKGDTVDGTMGDVHDILDESEDGAVYMSSSSLLSLWLLLMSILV